MSPGTSSPLRQQFRSFALFAPAPLAAGAGFVIMGARSDAEASQRMTVVIVGTVVTTLLISAGLLAVNGKSFWLRWNALATVVALIVNTGASQMVWAVVLVWALLDPRIVG
jgi:hypothetical protein